MRKDSLSGAEARRIALAAQGFGARKPEGTTGWRQMQREIRRMGLLQVDSVNVLVRSHYLPLFSRLGAYDADKLDEKAFHPRRRTLFEYWAHECSLLPLERQPLLRWRMARAARGEGIYNGYVAFAREQSGYIARVLDELRDRGPLSPRELSDPGRRGHGMWSRSRGKTALEYLFWTGQVSAVRQRSFERVYDLSERVLPAAVLNAPTPDDDTAQRELLMIAARALGVASEADLRDYFRLPSADSKRAVAALAESGQLQEMTVAGWRQPAYLHPEARLPRRVAGAALLSPFDPLIWERARTERLFDFHYRLEIYTPAAKRRHGYYVLPFLLDGSLVARVDLKADRQAGLLRVPAAHGEEGVETGAVAERLAGELRHLADWLGLDDVRVGRHGELTGPLRQSLRNGLPFRRGSGRVSSG